MEIKNKKSEIPTNYLCTICNKFYASQSSLCHHNKTFHKIETIKNVILVNESQCSSQCLVNESKCLINKNKCNYCDKILSCKQSKSQHHKICKIKNKNINNEELFKNEISDLKDKINILLKSNKIHPIIKSHINNNIDNNNNNNNNLSIIKCNDNNFIVDFNNNILLFYDKPIKFFYYNEQVYFKAKDIATILEYENTTQAIIKNIDNDDRIKISDLLGVVSPGDYPHLIHFLKNEDSKTIFINESGFYCLIIASKKPEAIKFKKWVTSVVLPSIRKTGSYNIINNYVEENLNKYINKDCVYILHIRDNIYKYGNTSHIIKRLQTHKTTLNYNRIVKIYEFDNMNFSKTLENKIKIFTKSININIQYGKHIEFFKINDSDLNNFIKTIDNLSLNIIKDIDNNNNNNNNNNVDKTIKIEEEKTKQLEINKIIEEDKLKQLEINKIIEEDKTKQLNIEYKILQLKLELFNNNNNNNKIIL